jgi:multiple antibiotic resistance protein
LNDFINSILLVFAGLFPIVNPVGDAPIFLTLTRHCTMGERHTLASKVAVNSFILLTFSLFLGSYVLEFFGITLPVLRIAGGLVVTAFAGSCCMPATPRMGRMTRGRPAIRSTHSTR